MLHDLSTSKLENSLEWRVSLSEVIDRLSKLAPLKYDQVREEEAKKLKVRVKTLDEEVEKNRIRKGEDSEKDELIDGLDPCGYDVEGNHLAKFIFDTLNKHLILPQGADTAITLWILASYAINSFRIFPKLCLSSPEKRCGKTTTLEVIESFANRALLSSNCTASVIFRAIDAWHPTLLIDEADTFLSSSDDLRGIINSGHTKVGAFALRNQDKDGQHQPTKYSTWTPMIIAMIKKPHSTIVDRSILIELAWSS